MSEDIFPRDWKNPTDKYLEMEKAFGKQKVCVKLLRGFRITRKEFAIAVKANVIMREDTDEQYEDFMTHWSENEKSFGWDLNRCRECGHSLTVEEARGGKICNHCHKELTGGR